MDPQIDPIFGPAAAFGYWSSTTAAFDSSDALHVNFDLGRVNANSKVDALHVRAVRGGPG